MSGRFFLAKRRPLVPEQLEYQKWSRGRLYLLPVYALDVLNVLDVLDVLSVQPCISLVYISVYLPLMYILGIDAWMLDAGDKDTHKPRSNPPCPLLEPPAISYRAARRFIIVDLVTVPVSSACNTVNTVNTVTPSCSGLA